MNKRPIAVTLALFFAACFASMIVPTSTALADSKSLTFTEAVTIGSTVLAPGTYNVVWVGSGPEVQVTFKQGSKIMATASARLVFEKSPHHRAFNTVASPDNGRILTRISFSAKALVFDLSG